MSTYRNFQSGLISDAPLASGSTTINSPAFANLPAIAAPAVMWLVLDPAAVAGTPEVVQVTAHTASATSVTAVRGQQSMLGGSAAREHLENTPWLHSATATDLNALLTTVLTTKGDIAVATGPNAVARQAVGSNGLPLIANSGVANGIEYAQLAAAGIADNAISNAKLADNAVNSAEIAAAAVTTAKLADDNVTGAKLAHEVLSAVQVRAHEPGSNQGADATGAFTQWFSFTNVTVPTWATQAYVQVTANRCYLTSASTTTYNLRIGVGGQFTNNLYFALDDTQTSAALAGDRKWAGIVTLSGTGSQTFVVQTARTSGSAVARIDTESDAVGMVVFLP